MSMIRTFPIIAVIVIVTAFSVALGCARKPVNSNRNAPQDSDLVFESYTAADGMLQQAPWLRDTRAPMLTASFVNINSLEDSSALGRMISEQIASRFSQQGFTMVELRLRDNVFIEQSAGEFMLSREVKNLSQAHNATAVVVGTYAVGRRSVYVNARLIRAVDNLILASFDYSLPLGPDTRALLASQ